MTKPGPPGGNHQGLQVLLTYVPILPSSQVPAGSSPQGLVLAPFRGVRYAEDRVSGLAEVTSPPYDVIAADIESQLFASDPHNIVRLILPRHPEGQPGSPYEDAAADLRQWLADGILVPDPDPALYVYEQVSAGSDCQPADGGVLQRGLIGAVTLQPPAAGIIQPHENVTAGIVAGRRQLMEATQANLEPVYLLYEGGHGPATELVGEVATDRIPLMEACTTDGLRHRLWAITEDKELSAIAADLAPRSALIADGHHRYAAYLQLRDRRQAGAAVAGPWDLGLALLVDSSRYPPQIGAIHRVILGLMPEAAARLAALAFQVTELPGGSADVPGALAVLAAAEQEGMTFLLTGAGHAYLLTNPDPALISSAIADHPAQLWQQMPAAVLQDLLLARIWGIEDDARSVRAIHDAATAIRDAEKEQPSTAVICSSMSADQVYQVAAIGRRVPRKSTSFGPKPRTGLVMRVFDEG